MLPANHGYNANQGADMIEILLSVCMVSDPQRCKDVHLTYAAESVTPHQCMMFGQAEIAKWSTGHPKWRVDRWKCQKPGQVAKI
jgi:hypothetical protein